MGFLTKTAKALAPVWMILGAIFIAGGILLVAIEPSKKSRERFAVEIDWDKVEDDPSVPMTIRWMGIPTEPTASPDAWLLQNINQRFNVTIAPEFLDSMAYEKKRPMMFASGDLPDVFWDGSPLRVRTHVRNGFLLELPYEVILKHAPNYVKALNRGGKEAWLYSWYKGKNYGLPTYNEGAISPRIGAWRADWLKKAGFQEAPATLAEMERALRYFRENDPDGNGLKDTYGWSPNVSHWSLAYSEVFAVYGILPFDFMLKDGKIVWGGVLPECKEPLKLLRRWYADELLDPDFIVDSQGNAVQNKFLNGKFGYNYPVDGASSYNPERRNSIADKLQQLTGGGTIIPGKPLKNLQGKRRARSWGGAAHVMQFGAHLVLEPQKVIRILRILDAIAADEKLYVEASSGKEGLHWRLDKKEGIELLPPFKDNTRLQEKEMLSKGGFSTIFFYPNEMMYTYKHKYLPARAQQFTDTYSRPEWSIVNALGKSDILPSASRYLETLRNRQQQVYAKIITGEEPLDSFDDFIKEWREKGGEILTKEANAMYAIMADVFRKTGATKDAQ